MLDTICNDANAEAFLEPVDWQELELIDYPKIVKNPMDLSTVRSKLLSGEYTTLDEFIAQIQLIWDNCKLYNMVGSHIYKICEKMERSYNRELSKFKTQQGLIGKRTKEKAQAEEVSEVVEADMKRDLCGRIKKLPAEQMTKFA